MPDERKKPGVTFWVSALMVATIAYPFAYGPVYWAVATGRLPDWAARLIMLPFLPLLLLARACDPVMAFVQWYLGLWTR